MLKENDRLSPQIYITNPVLGVVYDRVEEEDPSDNIIPPTKENTEVASKFRNLMRSKMNACAVVHLFRLV